MLAIITYTFHRSYFILNNNTTALLNATIKAGRGVVLPPRVWLAFEGIGFPSMVARLKSLSLYTQVQT
jgi:hypothetical protein